ncbi:MAG TPA: hypothetical protein VGC65_09735 [Bacteroidia bacterium]|jgi:hypothetical protein
MKKRVFAYLLIILLFLFPFRYAYLQPGEVYVVNMIWMIITILGMLAFIFLTTSDDKAK